MKKIFIKLLATIMVLTVFAQLLPVAFAAEEKDACDVISAQNGDYALTTANPVGEIISEIAESDNGSSKNENYTIFDLAVEKNKVCVQLQVESDSILVVAAYDQKTNKMVTSGKKTVTADDDIVEISIDENKLPEFFIVKAFLLDPDTLMARCEAYTCYNYTEEMQEFFSKTVDDFDEEEVINLDEDKTNNFIVLKDGAKTVEATSSENILVDVDEENGTYTIENPDSEMLSLKKDDILNYVYGDGENEFYIISVNSVSESGNNRIIISAQDAEAEDLLQYVRIETAVTTSDNKYVDPEDFEPYSKSKKITRDRKYLVTIPEVEVGPSFSFDLGDEDTVLYGGVELKVGIVFKLYFAIDVKFLDLDTYTDFKFLIKQDLDFNVGVMGKISSKEYKLPYISIPIIAGVDLAGEPTFKVDATAKIQLSYSLNKESGVTYKTGEGKRTISKNDADYEPNISSEISIKAGIELKMSVVVAKVIHLSVTAEAGIKLTSVPWNYELSADIKHLCPACFSCDLKLYGSFGVGVSAGLKGKFFGITIDKKFDIISVNLADGEIPILEFYVSNVTGRFEWHLGTCPNKAYRVTFTVTDNSSNPISGAKVGYLTTGSDGKASDFFKDDTTETFSVSAKGYKDSSVIFAVNGKVLNVKVTLDKEDETEEPETPVVPGKITWSYDSATKTLSISGSGAMDNYTNYRSAPWHKYCKEIETVKITEGVTHLGDYAFSQCNKLTKINIPQSVVSIGTGAFYGCELLPSIILGDNVKTIGDYAFYYCFTADKLQLGSSVNKIGAYAFAQCTGLGDVVIPSSVNEIGNHAFAWCRGIGRISVMNPDCVIYASDETIYEEILIAGYPGSTAQDYAELYNRVFATITYASVLAENVVADNAAAYSVDSEAEEGVGQYKAGTDGAYKGEYYVILVLDSPLKNNDFTADQLLYIDQVVAEKNGEISFTYTPREDKQSVVLIVGKFSDGTMREVDYVQNIDCTCLCHSESGFLRFIYKIYLFFVMIFGGNTLCNCGISHF